MGSQDPNIDSPVALIMLTQPWQGLTCFFVSLLLWPSMVEARGPRKRVHAFKGTGKSFFDFESPQELVWRTASLLLALSPFLLLAYCLLCSKDKPEVEKERRAKKNSGDFSVGKKGK